MWIRSQDKKILVDINIAFVAERQIAGITTYDICYHKEIDIDLGVYSTYEKALKVLDKIENKIGHLENLKRVNYVQPLNFYVFQMPLD